MVPRVISFSSGKGGVGKTTVVANLGKIWASQGYQTLLIDGDWSLGKLGITLGARPQWTTRHVLSGEVRLEQAILPLSQNLSLLAAPSGIVGFEELKESARNQLYFEMESLGKQYDRILLDHSSGIHWGVIQFAAASHQHVIVTTSEPTSYTDAYAIMKILSRRFAIRDFSLLVTMSQDRTQSESIIGRFADVARSHLDVRVTLLDIFPWNPQLGESIRKQKAFVELFPLSSLTAQLEGVCRKIEEGKLPMRHGLNFFYEDIASHPSLNRDEKCPL
jgi:flagellar biosynthesis protein FlhG